MKKSTLILLISTAIFFTSTLVLLYLNYLKPTQTFTPTTGTTPTDTPVPTTNPTADWKTYNSVEFAFSINYPKDLLIKNFINDQYNRTVSFVGSDINFSITLKKANTNFNLDKYYFMDSPIARTTTLSSQKANIYEMSNGYCDGPGCSQPYIAVVAEYNGDIYSISFFGDSKLSPLESQILSTFKFISTDVTPTKAATLTKVKILDTTNWVEHSCGPISYKIPAEGYDIKCNQNDATSFGVSIVKNGAYVNSASIAIRQYDGGSRRQYWIKTMGASDSEVSQYMRFQESLFGDVVGLDVFASGGWWQGGYSSPILIANGKTIVAINGGRDFQDQTGKISRWDFTDTIASTIKFNN